MYADRITDSMRRAIDETYRRRKIQMAHNEEHGIEPASIVKQIKDITDRVRAVAESRGEYIVDAADTAADAQPSLPGALPKDEIVRLIKDLESQMRQASKMLEFEKAAMLRDQVVELKRMVQEDKLEEDKPAKKPILSRNSQR
jgi:excinuclease ABC subunit B